jgi:hypothetical protein
MAFQGGYVIHTTRTFAIFWHPAGTTPLEANYTPLIDRYLADLGNTDHYDILTQYRDSINGSIVNSSTFGGEFDDPTTGYPHVGSAAQPLTDADIQSEVDHAIAITGGSWSAQPLASLTNVFLVFLPKGVYLSDGAGTSFANFCAYHSAFGADSAHVKVYGAMPYAGTATYDGVHAYCTIPPFVTSPTPNNDVDADSEINLISHELFEATSDPYPAGTGFAGWYNGDVNHEIGDQCNFVFGAVAADHSDVTLHGHAYLVQTEWSNGDSTGTAGCVVTYPDNFAVSAPPNAIAGEPFIVTVTAQNHRNLPAGGYTGTVHFSSSDSGATLPPDTTLTDGTGSFNVVLRHSATVTATDTTLATLTGCSATVGVAVIVQHGAAGVFHAGTVTVTMPMPPAVGDTLVLAELVDAGTPVAPAGWPAVTRVGIGGGDVSSTLGVYEHVVMAGDASSFAAGSSDPRHNITAEIYEITSGSGTVERVVANPTSSYSPLPAAIFGSGGDLVLGIFAANPVHDLLSAVSAGAGLSNVVIADREGVSTGMPHALGAFSATLDPGSTAGQFTVVASHPLNLDGAVTVVAFRP